MIDGEDKGLNARRDSLNAAYEAQTIRTIGEADNVLISVPTWSIATWFTFLDGGEVQESDSDYPRLTQVSDCAVHVDRLAEICRGQSQSPSLASVTRRQLHPIQPSLRALTGGVAGQFGSFDHGPTYQIRSKIVCKFAASCFANSLVRVAGYGTRPLNDSIMPFMPWRTSADAGEVVGPCEVGCGRRRGAALEPTVDLAGKKRVPANSVSDSGDKRKICTRPARDSLMLGTVRKLVDPVNRKRPGVLS